MKLWIRLICICASYVLAGLAVGALGGLLLCGILTLLRVVYPMWLVVGTFGIGAAFVVLVHSVRLLLVVWREQQARQR